MEASECKCCVCGRQAVAFWPCIDPDIPAHPYCRKCLDEAKTRVLMESFGYSRAAAEFHVRTANIIKNGNEQTTTTMKREIKFRGRRADGAWVYGTNIYIPIKDKWKTRINGCRVDPATVGQYTGLRDRHGTEAYEHDIMQYKGVTGVITYYSGRAQFLLKVAGRAPLTLHNLKGIIIGNVHDNPEQK